jgi:hypothetical protein
MNRQQQKRVEEEELVRRSREQGEEQVAESLCSKHDWRPVIRAGTLPPPRSECPGCKAESLRARDTDRGERVLVHPGIPTTPEEHGLMDHWLELERRRHPGRVEPGSEEEERALEQIEAAREDERTRDHPQRAGRLVSGRIEHGEWVEYRALPRRGIARVGVA